jgi:hypothetical protein
MSLIPYSPTPNVPVGRPRLLSPPYMSSTPYLLSLLYLSSSNQKNRCGVLGPRFRGDDGRGAFHGNAGGRWMIATALSGLMPVAPMFRGNAIRGRNIHAALYDAARLCGDL